MDKWNIVQTVHGMLSVLADNLGRLLDDDKCKLDAGVDKCCGSRTEGVSMCSANGVEVRLMKEDYAYVCSILLPGGMYVSSWPHPDIASAEFAGLWNLVAELGKDHA